MSNKLIYALLALFCALMWWGIIHLLMQFPTEERRVDCSLVEFHPDYTNEVRKACRERRRVKL